MSVLLETSKGDIVIDLYVDDCPKAATNFLKCARGPRLRAAPLRASAAFDSHRTPSLPPPAPRRLCKLKYYNNCIFYNVQRDFIAQTGDPTNTGRGGESVWGVLYGDQARFFEDEIRPHVRHTKRGMVGMAGEPAPPPCCRQPPARAPTHPPTSTHLPRAGAGENSNASQFYITTGAELQSLDEKHTLFGEVAEGWDVLDAINDAPCDAAGRPLQNIRIRHTLVLEDPTPDPPSLEEHVPEGSPAPQYADDGRLEDDWAPGQDTRAPEEIEKSNRQAR
jgi:peptidyl-prolyl cis-trans isomerase-like 4